ncbi:PIN/TRAM domain-containing protein [Patescibacteria group bacterium]
MKKDRSKSSKRSANQAKKRSGKAAGDRYNLSQKALPKPTSSLAQVLAKEIAKNLSSFGQLTVRPFRRSEKHVSKKAKKKVEYGDNPILVDSSVLIDNRIVAIVNSGFLAGTLIIPEFVLTEIQHVADSSDQLRRTKGRLGLEVVSKLKAQKANDKVSVLIVKENPAEVKEVDHKLIALSKKHKFKLMTVDYNLAQLARAQSVKVMNINDLAQAIKVSLIPGQDLKIRISHEGKERKQGVGYLDDGTMIVVEDAKNQIGADASVVITKIHQSPAGQLFFARLS